MTREQQITAAEGRRSYLAYEPPRLSVLGTFHELTKKIAGGHADAGNTKS
jgi:hypothetical protein